MRLEIARRAIAGIIIGEDDRSICPAPTAIAVGEGAHGRRRHDARHVIAAEDDRPLFGAGRRIARLAMIRQ